MARNKGKKRSKYVSEQVKQAYKRERARIQQFLSRARKRGYQFPENILPSIPKTVKPESIRRLEKITTQTMYEKAKVYFSETEYYTGLEYKHMENIERARKASETRHYNKYDMKQTKATNFSVIKRVRELIENSEPKNSRSLYTNSQKEFLLYVTNKSITDSTEEQYSKYLLESENTIAYNLSRIVYASTQEENIDTFRQLQVDLSFYSPDLEQMQKAQEISEDAFRTMTLAEMEENPFL